VDEVTKTDVAQAESRLAAGRAQLAQAESQYITSRSNYVRIIGVQPGKLAPGTPVDNKSPPTLDQAIAVAGQDNPNVTAAALGVDVAALQVKINEGTLYPTVVAALRARQGYSVVPQPNILRALTLQAFGTVTVPFYQGGSQYATIRQSKETFGHNRINLDIRRDMVQQQTVQAWGQVEAAKARRGRIGHPHVVLKLRQIFLRRALLEERPRQHEFRFKRRARGLHNTVKGGSLIARPVSRSNHGRWIGLHPAEQRASTIPGLCRLERRSPAAVGNPSAAAGV
jgi:hypothetical protein